MGDDFGKEPVVPQLPAGIVRSLEKELLKPFPTSNAASEIDYNILALHPVLILGLSVVDEATSP